jgi:transcriptional regulator of acetoin/glycerol metabolism
VGYGTKEERERIIAALSEVEGNATRAEARAGLPRRTFVEKLMLYKIPRPRPPGGTSK